MLDENVKIGDSEAIGASIRVACEDLHTPVE